MIAKEPLKMQSEPTERVEILPWWVGPSTLERVRQIGDEIRGSVYSLSERGRPFGRSLARLGFAAAGAHSTT